MTYPSWRYHRTEPARIVRDPREDEDLGSAWKASPADHAEPEPEPEPSEEELAWANAEALPAATEPGPETAKRARGRR